VGEAQEGVRSVTSPPHGDTHQQVLQILGAAEANSKLTELWEQEMKRQL
jgi:hypothetical protein